MTAISENAKAFRDAVEGLARENAASARSIAQGLDDQAKKAEKSAQEISEKNQKLVERIRERAEERKLADEKARQEIQVGEDLDAEDPDPDVEHFSEQLHTSWKAEEEQEAAATTAQSAEQPIQQAGPGPSASQQLHQRPADDGWNVQAGRFGRRDKQPTPPAAASKPPAPPKPAPRRPQTAFDEDDYENQTWLR